MRLHGPDLRPPACDQRHPVARERPAPRRHRPAVHGPPLLHGDIRHGGWGHDLLTGAAFEEKDHAALQANGKAILRAAHWTPPHESPRDEHPLVFTTGRTVYHF